MPLATSLSFAAAARRLAAESRRRGWVVPAFRSPPRLPGPRTLRRTSSGVVVAVRLRHRSVNEVVSDMVDGVLAANGLSGQEARAQRRQLIDAVLSDLLSSSAA